MKRITRAVGALVLLTGATGVHADILDDILGAGKSEVQGKFDDLSGTMASVFSYKSVAPAASLAGGIIPVGVDVALETSFTQLPANSIATGILPKALQSSASIPFPKLHGQVGVAIPFIPFVPAIDAGVSYMALPGAGKFDGVDYLGGELKVNIASGNVVMPAIAVRGVFSKFGAGYNGKDLLSMSTYGAELAVSKGIGIGIKVTPYAGLGYHYYKASSGLTAADVLDSTIQTTFTAAGIGLGDKIIDDASGGQFKWFLGASIKLLAFNIGAEVDQTGDAMTYTGKLGLVF